MERCIHKYLYNFALSNNIISNFQSGFIKGDSTTNQLTYMYNDIVQALDEGTEVRAVFCDMSKAFDRVWHKGLLIKLKYIGIKVQPFNWFESYLSDRQQRVIIANTSSNWSHISAGVPQGFIFGLLLFLIYISDIVNDIHANIRLFADDTSLYIDEPTQASIALNTDLTKIVTWSNTWLVSFTYGIFTTISIPRGTNSNDYNVCCKVSQREF